MNKIKCLVTGGMGFIFSNFIRKSIYDKHPYNFVNIDKITQSHLLNSMYTNHEHHTRHFGDVADAHFINIIFEYERPEIVIHAASTQDQNDLIKTNVLGTQTIIDACLKWGVKKLIYISSGEVYGPTETPSTEDTQVNPSNTFAASKASAEMLIQAAHKSHGLEYNIIRTSNNYGQRQTKDKLIPKTIKHILEDRKIPVFGKGQQLRDWIHVWDHCNAIFTIMKSETSNQIYNVSSNHEFTNIEVVQHICNLLNKGHNLIEYVDDEIKRDIKYSLNSDKIRGLGWKPGFKFTNGLSETLDWYLKNKWYLA